MKRYRVGMLLLLAAGTLGTFAGCSGSSKDQPTGTVELDTFPPNYRTQIVGFLRQSLTNRADFRGAMIAEPAIKPVGPSQHFVVCVQFTPRSGIKTKAAVYLAGQMTQFVDATPEQCANAVFTPFKELDAAIPAA
jgi:hypothetical protein